MKNTMKLFISIFVLVALFFSFSSTVLAADPFEGLCASTPSAEVCQNRAEQQNTQTNAIYGKDGVIPRVTGIIATVVGIASVIIIIVAGMQYITSTGDPAKTAKAKDTILFAIIGIVVAVSAQSIVIFVVNKL